MVRLWGPLPGSFWGRWRKTLPSRVQRQREQWSGGCKRHPEIFLLRITPWAFPPLWAAVRKTLLLFSTNHIHPNPLKLKEKTPRPNPEKASVTRVPSLDFTLLRREFKGCLFPGPSMLGWCHLQLGFLPMIPTPIWTTHEKVFHPSLKNNKQKCDDWELIEIYLSQKG